MARFDEIELQPAVFDFNEPTEVETDAPAVDVVPAARFRRLLALLTDLSLFLALSLALSPLLPASTNWIAIGSLAAFVVMLSFYYFAGCWLLWGKTIGGTIFDVKVVSVTAPEMAFKHATQRWAGLMFSLASAGLGFAVSLPDRLSSTCCVSPRVE